MPAYVGLFDHGGHGLFDASFAKLKLRVLLPHSFNVKVGAPEKGLEEGQRSRVGEGSRGRVIISVSGNPEKGPRRRVQVVLPIGCPALHLTGA